MLVDFLTEPFLLMYQVESLSPPLKISFILIDDKFDEKPYTFFYCFYCNMIFSFVEKVILPRERSPTCRSTKMIVVSACFIPLCKKQEATHANLCDNTYVATIACLTNRMYAGSLTPALPYRFI